MKAVTDLYEPVAQRAQVGVERADVEREVGLEAGADLPQPRRRARARARLRLRPRLRPRLRWALPLQTHSTFTHQSIDTPNGQTDCWRDDASPLSRIV